MSSNQIGQAADLLVRQHTRMKEFMMVYRPTPLVVTVIQKYKESNLRGNDIIRNATGPQFEAVLLEKIVPSISSTTE